jgi:hypothetical protein
MFEDSELGRICGPERERERESNRRAEKIS